MSFIQSLLSDLLRLVFRVVLLIGGLLFAAAVVFLVLALLAGWLLRALWARLTGRTVSPWVMRISPREVFSQFAQRRGFAARAVRPAPQVSDVTDVEAKDRR